MTDPEHIYVTKVCEAWPELRLAPRFRGLLLKLFLRWQADRARYEA